MKKCGIPQLIYHNRTMSQLNSGHFWNTQSGSAACHRFQIWAMVAESHSRVPEGYVWSWPHGPISCAGWGQSSSLALYRSSYLRLSLFTASSGLAVWCAPQSPSMATAAQPQLSPCICPPACLWRKRDSAGLHSAQIPPSAESVNIHSLQLLYLPHGVQMPKYSSINTSTINDWVFSQLRISETPRDLFTDDSPFSKVNLALISHREQMWVSEDTTVLIKC